MNKIEVTPEEEEELFRRYCNSDGLVSYNLFVKDIENCIFLKYF